ncbi:MAG: hypothetical protein N2378_04340 [Chloroflexaceae bacterium]|nr:hypothetical protein [Chloroflexaceae bacterium]
MSPRLPGVRFEARASRPSAMLPRMDIAAFVGFATCGPLDLPVVVEDVAHFAEVFGPDAPLARDQRRGRTAHAYLAPTVRAFFRGGGRRCWVVRVAGADAVTSHFSVPGLWAADGPTLRPVVLAARAPGSWADQLRVAATLARTPLPASALATLPLLAAPGDELALSVPPGLLLTGDLLRLADGARQWWAVVTEGGAAARVVLVEAAASPPWPAGAELLRCDLWVWQDAAAPLRLRDLGFAPSHPRYLGALPDDLALYRRDDPPWPARGPDHSQLWRDVSAPRFPLAASDQGLLLPLGLPDQPEPDLAARAEHDGRGPLERDGLSVFGAHLFLDPDLAGVNLEALTAQAEWLRYQQPRPRPLRGLHALLEIDEVALVSVPDAVHPGWERIEPAPPPAPLPSAPPPRPDWWAFLPCAEPGGPTLTAAASPAGEVRLRWDAEPAEAWSLEESSTPSFGAEAEVWQGVERRATLTGRAPGAYFYRVRAGGATAGAWSNVAVAQVPAPAAARSEPRREYFLRCDLRVLDAPALSLADPPSAEGAFRLRWTGPDEAEARYIVEEASRPDWSDAFELATTARREVSVYGRPAGVYYYRARVVVGTATSDWSAGLVVQVRAAPPWTLREPAREPQDLLATTTAVQRALLRACASRGDALALLSLPAAAREEATLAAPGLLGGPAAPPLTVTWPEGSVVIAPIGPGEALALSHGALYHPWPIMRDEGGPEALPPDGPLAGLYARRATERGAWVAPANQPLPGPVALTPRLDPERRVDLLAAQVNEVLQAPRGFLTMSATTLSRDPELRPVGARRLLMLLRRLALRQGAGYVFEPNSEPFRRIVERDFAQLLGWMFERGAFAGATPQSSFRVEVRASGGGEDGRLIVELRVAPSQPLVFLTVRLVQTGDRIRVVEAL